MTAFFIGYDREWLGKQSLTKLRGMAKEISADLKLYQRLTVTYRKEKKAPAMFRDTAQKRDNFRIELRSVEAEIKRREKPARKAKPAARKLPGRRGR